MKRSGFSLVLPTVVGVVLVVLTLGATLIDRGKGLGTALRRGGLQDRAIGLARDANTEAVHRIRTRANLPGRPEFEMVRSNQVPYRHPLGSGELPWAARSAGDGLERIDGVEVTVLRRAFATGRPEERVDYEAMGVMRFVAGSEGALGVSARHTLELGFRTVLVAPPRPFDAPTFMLLHAEGLLRDASRGGEPSLWMRQLVAATTGVRREVRAYAERFHQLVETWRKWLRDGYGDPSALREAISIFEGQSRRFAASVRGSAWPAREWCMEADAVREGDRLALPPQTARPPDGMDRDHPPEGRFLHDFLEPLSVYSFAAEVDLDAVALPRRMEEKLPEYDRALEAWQNFRTQLASLMLDPLGKRREVARVAPEYLEASRNLAASADPMAEAFHLFQEIMVEVSGDAHQQLRDRAVRLSPEELGRKAEFVFRDVESAASFLAVRPNPAGIVYVEDPSRVPLVLDLAEVTGRLMVIYRGELRVRRAEVANPGEDVLVLMSWEGMHCETPGTAARILASGSELSAFGDLGTGSLVIDGRGSSASFVPGLRGKLKRQDAISHRSPDLAPEGAPPDPRLLHASLSLEPQYERVDR